MPARDDLLVGPKMKPVVMQLKCIRCGKAVAVHAAAFDPAFDGFVVAGSCAECAEQHKKKKTVETHDKSAPH